MILQFFRTRIRQPLLVSPLVRIRPHIVVIGCLHPVIIVKGAAATLPERRVTRDPRRRMLDRL